MDVLKQLVSGRLRANVIGPHPDAELMASFTDRSLSQTDRDHLLEHVAACTDCRDILYLALPEAAETQAMLAVKPRPRSAVRWATLVASVLILGSVVVTNRQLFLGHSRREVTSLPSSVPVALQNSPTEPSASASAKVRPPLKHMTAKPQVGMQFDQSDQIHFAAAQPAATPAEHVAAARDLALAAAVPFTWGLSASGAAQRSLDSGKTWQTVPVTEGVSFTVIKAVGREVWAGGNAGTLYHSADSGQSWSKIEPIYAGEKLRANITGINFSDPKNGSLSTINGEVWTTSDGGQSWRLK